MKMIQTLYAKGVYDIPFYRIAKGAFLKYYPECNKYSDFLDGINGKSRVVSYDPNNANHVPSKANPVWTSIVSVVLRNGKWAFKIVERTLKLDNTDVMKPMSKEESCLVETPKRMHVGEEIADVCRIHFPALESATYTDKTEARGLEKLLLFKWAYGVGNEYSDYKKVDTNSWYLQQLTRAYDMYLTHIVLKGGYNMETKRYIDLLRDLYFEEV